MLTDDLRGRLASNNFVSTVFVFNNDTFASVALLLQTRMLKKKGCARGKRNVYLALYKLL